MLDALYEKETAATLDDRLRNPQPAPRREAGVWQGALSAGPRGFAIAVNESARALYRTVSASADATLRRQQEEVDDFTAEAIFRRRLELDDERAAIDAALRSGADYWKADPGTQGTAAQIVQGATQFLTKVGVYTAATRNPVAVAGLVGGDTGVTEFLNLRDQGVDEETARKVGLVRGASAAAAVALPAAGTTALKTAALIAAGGPGAYVVENLAAREILKAADYSTLADQIDPFDPVGLAVATIGAAGVGGAAYWLRARGARGAATPEEVDAARVVVAREAADAQSLAKPGDLVAMNRDAAAAQTAEMQIARGQRVNIADTAPLRDGDVIPEQLRLFEDEVNAALRQLPPEPPAAREVEVQPEVDVATPRPEVGRAESATETAAQQIAARVPDLDVEVEIGGVPQRMKASEAIAAIKAAAQTEIDESNLIRVAAACALGVA